MGLVMVTVDVLLAAYQGERWLSAQLESLRNQTHHDLRVLMQDDGSTDGTQDVLRQAAEADGRFCMAARQGEHLGAAGNFFSLLAQSDAPYCALCDQDDRWAPTRLERCLEAMRRAEQAWGAAVPLLVHSDCRLIDEQGRVQRESFFRHQGWNAKTVTLAPLLVQNNVTGCTVLMNEPLRRLAAELTAGRDIPKHDWFLALLAAAFGHVTAVEEPLVDYRQHGGNAVGASREPLPVRAWRALADPKPARERIALTYRHTRLFLECCGDRLPVEARSLCERYLATQRLPRLQRVLTVQRLGCRMQSPLTRAGQLFFG